MTETVKEIKLTFDNVDENGSAGSNVDGENESGLIQAEDASQAIKSLGKLTDGYEKPEFVDEDELTTEE